MGNPSPPCGIPSKLFPEGDVPLSKPSTTRTCKGNASAGEAFDAFGHDIGYTHTPMTTVVNPSTPVPPAIFPSLGSKGKSIRFKGTHTIKGFARRFANRWCSDAEAAITYLANSPTMWHLVAPAYLDLIMKAGAMYKAKYAQPSYAPGREHPAHVPKSK